MRVEDIRLRSLALGLTFVAAACGENPARPTAPDQPRSAVAANTDIVRQLLNTLQPHDRAASRIPIVVGAGDIARCYPGFDATQFTPPGPENPAWQTADLLESIPGTVIAVGDNAYELGALTPDYTGCYGPTWGRPAIKARTRPAAGNHEYLSGTTGYLAYFGAQAGPPGLYYYGYDVGSWHVIVLNSTPQVYLCWAPELTETGADPAEIPPEFRPGIAPPANVGVAAGRACVGDAAQQAWLVAELTAHRRDRCTLVYFHHPRFSSGMHGNHYQMQRIWDIMYAFGVDVVIDGHDHLYERFAPQTSEGVRDDRWGIRQFTVGTGGAEFYGVSQRQPNSEVVINDTHGVIALALDRNRYGWAFVGVDHSVRDAGSTACHGAPLERLVPSLEPSPSR